MKILAIGATGATDREIIKQAVAQCEESLRLALESV